MTNDITILLENKIEISYYVNAHMRIHVPNLYNHLKQTKMRKMQNDAFTAEAAVTKQAYGASSEKMNLMLNSKAMPMIMNLAVARSSQDRQNKSQYDFLRSEFAIAQNAIEGFNSYGLWKCVEPFMLYTKETDLEIQKGDYFIALCSWGQKEVFDGVIKTIGKTTEKLVIVNRYILGMIKAKIENHAVSMNEQEINDSIPIGLSKKKYNEALLERALEAEASSQYHCARYFIHNGQMKHARLLIEKAASLGFDQAIECLKTGQYKSIYYLLSCVNPQQNH